jgi:hypothetical protein
MSLFLGSLAGLSKPRALLGFHPIHLSIEKPAAEKLTRLRVTVTLFAVVLEAVTTVW